MLNRSEKCEKIAHHMSEILEILGFDRNDPALQKTPERVARLFVEELFVGLEAKELPAISLEKESGSSNQTIILRKIRVSSTCAHHFLPMWGYVDIAYRPFEDGVIGFSHLHRIVRHFAQRAQLQERLSTEIIEALMRVLRSEDVALRMKLHHCCMSMRNSDDVKSEVETLLLRGSFITSPF